MTTQAEDIASNKRAIQERLVRVQASHVNSG
jgi:hypothetical protein